MKDSKNGNYWKDASPPRKITDSSLTYLQEGSQKYGSFDLFTKLRADLLYARWEGLEFLYEGGKPDISEKMLENFMDRMDIPDTKDQKLVDIKNACYEDREIIVPVRKISEMRKGTESVSPDQYYNVRILDICKEDDTPEEKILTIDHIDINCDCIRDNYQKTCRAPYIQRKAVFDDNRDRTSIPSPYVVPFCPHASIAMNYSSIRLGAFSMGLFDLSKNVVQIEKEAIERMKKLGMKKSWPIYRINWALQDYAHRMFDPLIKLTKSSSPHEELEKLYGEL